MRKYRKSTLVCFTLILLIIFVFIFYLFCTRGALSCLCARMKATESVELNDSSEKIMGVDSVSPINFFSIARLGSGEGQTKIFVGEIGSLGHLFIFTDMSNNIINTLTIENYNIEGPSYRVVKGKDMDWLVVTTIGKNGVGFIEFIDSWYIVNVAQFEIYGEVKKVTSYVSKIAEDNFGELSETLSDAQEIYDDNFVNVKFSTRKCSNDEPCTVTSKIETIQL